MARLKDFYKAEIAPALMKKFEYKSVMQIPKLDKIVINVGVGDAKDNSKAIRLSGLISSPSWLIYNVANVAIGAIICEILSLISIALGIIRHDIKRK